MMAILKEIFYRPLFNLAVFFYGLIPGGDLGFAIITLTLVMRVALFPLSRRALLSQKEMAAIAPQVNAIKEKFKKDNTAQSAAIMQLYKEHKINPLSGCLPILIQIPILISLYQVFLAISGSNDFSQLYPGVTNPGTIQTAFLGIIDLAKSSPLLALLAGGLQFAQTKLSMAGNATAPGMPAGMGAQMLYFFPIMIIIISWNLPAGLGLYWVTTTAFSVIEQLYIKRGNQKGQQT